MYYVYALYSITYNKIYVGYTSNLNQRLESHNHTQNKSWTSKFKPWILLYSEKYDTKDAARRRELQLKSAQGRKFIKSLISL